MYRTSDEFLPCTRFAGNQHGRLRRSDHVDLPRCLSRTGLLPIKNLWPDVSMTSSRKYSFSSSSVCRSLSSSSNARAFAIATDAWCGMIAEPLKFLAFIVSRENAARTPAHRPGTLADVRQTQLSVPRFAQSLSTIQSLTPWYGSSAKYHSPDFPTVPTLRMPNGIRRNRPSVVFQNLLFLQINALASC